MHHQFHPHQHPDAGLGHRRPAAVLRLRSRGHYDAWGRITPLPAGLTTTPSGGTATVGYDVNDLARSTTQAGVTRTWTLDSAGRIATMGTTGVGSTALANHYGDPSTDAPDWTLDTSSGGTSTIRRYLLSLTGGLAIEAPPYREALFVKYLNVDVQARGHLVEHYNKTDMPANYGFHG